jgi:hypothetical protein
MISKEVFERIRENHGDYASWAIWKNETNEFSPASSNVNDLSVFDPGKNQDLFQMLNPKIIMVGKNWGGSGGIIDRNQKFRPFTNFHNTGKGRWDFKIRYAFRNTEFYGAYMTDIIKYYSASYANKNIINDPKINVESKKMFENELKNLGCENELIIAFGEVAYGKLIEFFGEKRYNIKQVTHYSFAGTYAVTGKPSSKENYRDLLLNYELKNWRR